MSGQMDVRQAGPEHGGVGLHEGWEGGVGALQAEGHAEKRDDGDDGEKPGDDEEQDALRAGEPAEADLEIGRAPAATVQVVEEERERPAIRRKWTRACGGR